MLTIIHGKIKTMTGTDYDDGFVQIENGKIKALGNMQDCPHEKRGTKVINAKGNLVMPGIIEAHCHMGITEEKKGMEWNPTVGDLLGLAFIFLLQFL